VSGELLVDLDEAARRLSMCRRSVQSLVYAGELRAVRIGRSRRIPVIDLEAYVNSLREANDRGTASLAVVSRGGHEHGLVHTG
jgi:excisionase family DNA binding protein